jgi:hypothetical protein
MFFSLISCELSFLVPTGFARASEPEVRLSALRGSAVELFSWLARRDHILADQEAAVLGKLPERSESPECGRKAAVSRIRGNLERQCVKPA